MRSAMENVTLHKIPKYRITMDHLSTFDNVSVPSIPYCEIVKRKLCHVDCQKDFDRLPRIYTQKCCSGSSAEERPSAKSEIFQTTVSTNKSVQKVEINVGAKHEHIPSTGWSDSFHHPQNHQSIPINDNVRSTDPQMWNFNPATCITPKSKPVIVPRRASCAVSHAYRRTPSSPVVISLELLDSLRGLSLPLAASTVGVSASAFKKACRRLGVCRWEYRRGPGRTSSKNVACPRGPVAT